MPELDPTILALTHLDCLQAHKENNIQELRGFLIVHKMLLYAIPMPIAEYAVDHYLHALGLYAEGDLEGSDIAVRSYYSYVKEHSGLEFDPEVVAQLELQCWGLLNKYKGNKERAWVANVFAQLYGRIFEIDQSKLTKVGEFMASATYYWDLAVEAGDDRNFFESYKTKTGEYLVEFYEELDKVLNPRLPGSSNPHV